MKQLLISRDSLETRVALLEDGRLAELYVERPGRLSLVGNIYKGRVENVLAGMDAAFVDIGLERNGFLYVDEVAAPEGAAGQTRKITNLLQGGKEVLVQVTRDAMGGKGPRLTTQLGFAGRYLVYLPAGRRPPGSLAGWTTRSGSVCATSAGSSKPDARRADRPHGRRGSGRGGPRPRSALPAAGLGRGGAPGGGRAAPRRSCTRRRSWPCARCAICSARSSAACWWTTRSFTGGW